MLRLAATAIGQSDRRKRQPPAGDFTLPLDLDQVEHMAGVALVAAIVSFIVTHSIAKSLAGAQEVGSGFESWGSTPSVSS